MCPTQLSAEGSSITGDIGETFTANGLDSCSAYLLTTRVEPLGTHEPLPTHSIGQSLGSQVLSYTSAPCSVSLDFGGLRAFPFCCSFVLLLLPSHLSFLPCPFILDPYDAYHLPTFLLIYLSYLPIYLRFLLTLSIYLSGLPTFGATSLPIDLSTYLSCLPAGLPAPCPSTTRSAAHSCLDLATE